MLCWVLELLVLPTMRVPLLMYWVSLPPVSLLVRVLLRSVWVVLVWVLMAVLVSESQLLVLGVDLGVVGRWVLLGVGARHSWLRA